MIIQEQKDDIDMQDEINTEQQRIQSDPSFPFPTINSEQDLKDLFEKIKQDIGLAEPEPSEVHIRHFKVDFSKNPDGEEMIVSDGMVPNPRYMKKDS